MTIVALPIAIVTSYVLYQRREAFQDHFPYITRAYTEVVVLGQERKRLAPRPDEIEAPKG